MDQNLLKTVVVDAGARYGLHPSWKPFKGEMDYYLFEPDSTEASRLEVKYASRSAEIKVEAKALGCKAGELTLNLFRNKAMSTSTTRNPVSELFKGEREKEVEVVETIKAPMVTIDQYAKDKNLKVDFLKLDTEGTEFEILQGALSEIENNVLGVRCEVAFDFIFEGKELFSDLHTFMLDKGYFLLNLDYLGKGDYQIEEVNTADRYGILTACDGVWLKRFDSILGKGSSKSEEALKVMKLATFCFHNSAPDVSIKLLLEAREKFDHSFTEFKEAKLYFHLDKLIHKHFYGLKWQPGQSLKNNQEIYYRIFEKDMKVMNDYMESLVLNPD